MQNFDLRSFLAEKQNFFNEQPASNHVISMSRSMNKIKIKRETSIKSTNGIQPKKQISIDSRENKGSMIEARNMLDYLVSPLKSDNELGQLIRNLDHQGDRNL